MPVPRVPGKRGRRKSSHRPGLLLKNFKTAAPTPPSSGSVAGGVSQWGMLGNDLFENCGPCGVEHLRIAKALVGVNTDGSPTFRGNFTIPTTKNTESWYFEYGVAMGEAPPKPDEGVDNASMLEWLYEVTGGVLPVGDDIQEWAYAELDVTDLAEIQQSMLDFHGVLMGCCLTDEAEQEFTARQPWQITPSEQPDPQMGHDWVLVEYTPADWTLVTWGALQKALIDFEKGEVSAGDLDAWVIITQEDADRAGVDMPALQAAIKAQHGKQNVPTPAPAPPVVIPPVVTPTPVVTPPAPAPDPPPVPAPPVVKPTPAPPVVKPPVKPPVVPKPAPKPMPKPPEWQPILDEVKNALANMEKWLEEHSE
jgi:hypothetical protein